MIPLRDTTRSRSFPIVNYSIIAMCGLVFILEISLGDAAGNFIRRFGVIPEDIVRLVGGESASVLPLVTLFTSMFLHGGWIHLLGNMLYLYVFGDNVEDRLGHRGYLLFYLLAGAGAALSEVWFRPASSVPLIGASGAIAGVLGAYFLLYPRARVLTLIPLFIFFPVVEVSAFFFLGLWFLMQFVQASLSSGADAAGGIAWWAHAGGFVIGIVLLPVFRMARR